VAVSVDGIPAEQDKADNGVLIPGQWTVPDFKDSRSKRDVVITYSDGSVETYVDVPFVPC
jgi:hypothetical protein